MSDITSVSPILLDKICARREVKAVVATVYAARRDRDVNPEGEFDSAGRWYPSGTEKGEGSFTGIRSPSRAWPYSYMLRARTRQHCALMTRAFLRGRRDLPADVLAVCQSPAGAKKLTAAVAAARKLLGRAACQAAGPGWADAASSADPAAVGLLADRLEEVGSPLGATYRAYYLALCPPAAV